MFDFKKIFRSLFLTPKKHKVASDEEDMEEVWRHVGGDIREAMGTDEQETEETLPPKDNS